MRGDIEMTPVGVGYLGTPSAPLAHEAFTHMGGGVGGASRSGGLEWGAPRGIPALRMQAGGVSRPEVSGMLMTGRAGSRLL
jgi:hypothetical protein